jgi:hypothetical protein
MRYYLVDYVPSGRGSGPALPDRIGFLLLAAPGYDSQWGLFAVDTEVPRSEHVRAVSAEVDNAVQSAERYPPALALARNAVASQFDSQHPTDDEFCGRYVQCLLEHMGQQAAAPYVFAEAIGDELGYLTRGQFYWVLRYLRGPEMVDWVSSDYFVYQNPASDFDLSPVEVDALLLSFSPAI